jgi:hypothetical protein
MPGRTALFCAGLAALTAFAPGAGGAQSVSSDPEQIRTFAGCAGRMTALRDHLALFGGDGVDSAEDRRRAHLAVLDALVETARAEGFDARQVLHWRIDARAAQSAVLSQAAFGTTDTARQRAGAASQEHIARCDRLILGA